MIHRDIKRPNEKIALLKILQLPVAERDAINRLMESPQDPICNPQTDTCNAPIRLLEYNLKLMKKQHQRA